MGNSSRKLQALLCLIAGVGLFLPLATATISGVSESVSFIKLFSTTIIIGDEAIIDGKILLGALAASLIVLLIPYRNSGIALKIISFVLVAAVGVIYWLDVSKLSSVVKLSSMVKYDFGYYMSLISIGLLCLLAIIDLFSIKRDRYSLSDEEYNNMKKMNNNINNTTYFINQDNNVPSSPTTKATETPEESNKEAVNSQIRLSDVIKRNTVVNNNEQNNDNLNK